jgi:hypothetical protein
VKIELDGDPRMPRMAGVKLPSHTQRKEFARWVEEANKHL